MTFYERVKGLCEQQGISVTKLICDLGFSKSAGTTWKASSNMPRPSTIKKVADYFGMTIDELKDGIVCIDYANIDTSAFNQPVFRHFLEINGGNERKAIAAYVEFEQAQTRDAMAERPNVFQNNGDNYGMIGTAHAPVKIVNGAEHSLTEQEAEILRIFSELSLVEQAKVIVYASELKDKGGAVGEKGSK